MAGLSSRCNQTDLGILNLLQEDGLMTYKELADQLNKTVSPIAERVSCLKILGYIKKTVAVIDLDKIRTVFIAFPHVQLTSHSEEVLLPYIAMVQSFLVLSAAKHETAYHL